MKQMPTFPAQVPVTSARPGRADLSIFSREINRALQLDGLGGRIRHKTEALLSALLSRLNLRQLLLTAAATAAFTALVLAASYLFLVQLAAYGW
jgi:hypothetical protein